MKTTKELSEVEKAEALKLNRVLTFGLDILPQLFSTKAEKVTRYEVEKAIGKSINTKDTKKVTNRVYKVDLFGECEYFIDGSNAKERPLKTHDRKTFKNFPKIYCIANRKAKLVSFYLREPSLTYSEDYLNVSVKGENARDYLICLMNANLPRGCTIHIDIYSTKLFKELEKQGFKVCHINKGLRVRDKALKDKQPYIQQVEHLFANIQKPIRRIHKQVMKLRELSETLALELTKSIILAYHFKRKHEALIMADKLLRIGKEVKVEA